MLLTTSTSKMRKLYYTYCATTKVYKDRFLTLGKEKSGTTSYNEMLLPTL